MYNQTLRKVLTDAPELIRESILSEEERKTVMAKSLSHYQAFSPIFKYHLILRYGVLLNSLEKMVQNFGTRSFLEIGSGTGSTCIYLAKKQASDQVFGIDLSIKRVKVSNKRIDWYGVDNCTLLHKNFLEYNPGRSFDFIYTLAAFEAINPKNKSVNRLVELCNDRCKIVLDMLNPYYFGHKRSYFTKDHFKEMITILKRNGFSVKAEYYGFINALDPTGITKKLKPLQKTVRLIAVRDPKQNHS
ncbi:class I SAM-dependent methyltransferase [Rhodohalobacter sulfatireducens]|uniref:Class I SAM-dependent methyltransferase n=1 Tax=Rhodohalobacter sulfatireducens TaxID=2911366 RepID=A0ABS9KJ10_9BACT|nr:class I SAM-dependent methyltransferase [Rhodohalobacter sulfatireducens]MCG2590831.1 class I SAM-dependent methyltransferase [Rhodohalobacter sulfatireducens]